MPAIMVNKQNQRYYFLFFAGKLWIAKIERYSSMFKLLKIPETLLVCLDFAFQDDTHATIR